MKGKVKWNGGMACGFTEGGSYGFGSMDYLVICKRDSSLELGSLFFLGAMHLKATDSIFQNLTWNPVRANSRTMLATATP